MIKESQYIAGRYISNKIYMPKASKYIKQQLTKLKKK